MRKIFLSIIFIFFSHQLIGQKANVDSLLMLISEENQISDSTRINVFLDLCAALRGSSIDSALNFCEIASSMSKKANNKSLEFKAINRTSIIHAIKGNYIHAIDMQMRCVNYYSQIGDSVNLSDVYLNLGNSFLKLKKNHDALDAYKKSMDLKSKINDEEGLSKLYNNTGTVYDQLDIPEKAIEYYLKALEIRYKLNNESLILQSLSNIASIYKNTDRLYEAEQICLEGIGVAKKINDNANLAYFYLYLAECYNKQRLYKKAIPNFQQAFLPANQAGLYSLEIELFIGLAEAYKGIKKLDSSLYYLELSVERKDSLYSENKLLEIGRLENKYNLELKEYENKVLIHAQEINKAEQKQSNIILGAISVFALLLITGTFVLWRNFNLKNKLNTKLIQKSQALSASNDLIKHKNEELEEQSAQIKMAFEQIFTQKEELSVKNTQITDSIRSAKDIQYAIVSIPTAISFDTNKNFIFWQPRDIVSGDFYWFEKINEKQIIFALGDCTGHGIPGAFMSLLGVHFLEFIVHSEKITSPEKILSSLNILIKKALKDDKNNQYGMDMGICLLDIESEKIAYSGAHINFQYIKNQTLLQIKGNSKSIGSKDKTENYAYVLHEISMSEVDFIYMFSDGFIDQLNAARKRFGSVQVQNLLKKVCDLPISAQYDEIKSSINAWQGDEEQTDDIILIGINPKSFWC